MQFTDQEIETIKTLIRDHGCDYSLETDSAEYQALGEKLGVLEPEREMTPEELKRQEEFANSPMGIAMRGMFETANKKMVELIGKEFLDRQFWEGEQWPTSFLQISPDGITKEVPINLVRVRLPKDYAVKAE